MVEPYIKDSFYSLNARKIGTVFERVTNSQFIIFYGSFSHQNNWTELKSYCFKFHQMHDDLQCKESICHFHEKKERKKKKEFLNFFSLRQCHWVKLLIHHWPVPRCISGTVILGCPRLVGLRDVNFTALISPHLLQVCPSTITDNWPGRYLFLH